MTQSQSPHINPVRQALVAKAVEDWIGQSWDPTGRNRLLYYRNLKVGTLSFEKAQSLTLNKLLTGTKVQLKELFPQSEDLFDAARRCRAILSRAQQSQQERGIETLKLAHGMATWKVEEGKSEPNAPVLLCSIKLTERGRFSDNNSSSNPSTSSNENSLWENCKHEIRLDSQSLNASGVV